MDPMRNIHVVVSTYGWRRRHFQKVPNGSGKRHKLSSWYILWWQRNHICHSHAVFVLGVNILAYIWQEILLLFLELFDVACHRRDRTVEEVKPVASGLEDRNEHSKKKDCRIQEDYNDSDCNDNAVDGFAAMEAAGTTTWKKMSVTEETLQRHRECFHLVQPHRVW